MMIIIIAQLFHIQLSTSANTKQFNSCISIFNSLCYLLSSLHSTKIFFFNSRKKKSQRKYPSSTSRWRPLVCKMDDTDVCFAHGQSLVISLVRLEDVAPEPVKRSGSLTSRRHGPCTAFTLRLLPGRQLTSSIDLRLRHTWALESLEVTRQNNHKKQ